MRIRGKSKERRKEKGIREKKYRNKEKKDRVEIEWEIKISK
jgi:hypothetical protein